MFSVNKPIVKLQFNQRINYWPKYDEHLVCTNVLWKWL